MVAGARIVWATDATCRTLGSYVQGVEGSSTLVRNMKPHFHPGVWTDDRNQTQPQGPADIRALRKECAARMPLWIRACLDDIITTFLAPNGVLEADERVAYSLIIGKCLRLTLCQCLVPP